MFFHILYSRRQTEAHTNSQICGGGGGGFVNLRKLFVPRLKGFL